MISAGEARKIILSEVYAVGMETADLIDAHKRVLAVDIVAAQDVPPFDNSSMDGYAIRVDDLSRGGEGELVKMQLMGEVGAGDVFAMKLEAGRTVRTLTGAPIPEGADAIVEQELVKLSGGAVLIPRSIQRGRNIRRCGEDVSKGNVVLRKGTVLRAAHLGVLASLGVGSVPVHRQPSVAYVTTGNELVEMAEELSPGKIRNSNAYTIWGLVSECGCRPRNLGVCRDDEKDLTKKLTEGLQHDVLITSGGVSVGDYDFVLPALEKLGVRIRFWKVNIKPGKPFAFGVFDDLDSARRVLVFALPGNPVSTMVTFLEFALPALRKLMGEAEPEERMVVRAKLEGELVKKDGKKHYSRGILRNEKGVFFVRTTDSQSSAVLTSLIQANCLVHIPEEKTSLQPGEEVEVELL